MADITSLSSINIGNKPYTLAASTIVGAVTASGGLTASTTGYATNGAITGYVDTVVAETIAETVNIADSLTTGASTAIPTVGAVTSYGITSLAPSAESTKVGFANAAATEKALAELQSKIGQISAFDGPYTSTDNIPKTEGKYKTNVIYLVGPTNDSRLDQYEEYISTDSTNLIMIGETSIDLTDLETLKGASGNWDKAYTATNANSGNWDNTYSKVYTASGNWDNAYTATSANSANWSSAYSAVTGAISVSADMIGTNNDTKLVAVKAVKEYVDGTKPASYSITGGNGITAAAVGTTYQVSGIAATTGAAGVIKKAYVSGGGTSDTVGILVFPE